ncbi:interferon-induced protein 44-like [Trichomycterus rosablanca]|uniref:interferon-induced protein 44-like n=1 Tax=Trichomycterus rosablanca TaxID=2290929 RepID=UPI002F360891
MANLHKRISAYVSDRQKKEEVQERLDEQRKCSVQPGDKVFVKLVSRKGDLETLIFNMSQEQQSLFLRNVKRQRLQREVILMQENAETQLKEKWFIPLERGRSVTAKSDKDVLEQELRRFKLSRSDVPYIRILIIGPVGAGKSSFINSVNNVFQGRITSGALVATTSGTSFTKEYETHYIERYDGSALPFIFNDIMGLEDEKGKGAHEQDLVSALKGLVEEGYKFNPACPQTPGENRISFNIEDQVFCLVNILAADTVSQTDQKLIDKMTYIRDEASKLKIPQVIIMTKPDQACPLVKNDLKKIYKSRKIKDKMQECSNLLGIPMNHIFPVKNYHEEIDPVNDMDVLILKALDQIVNIANDAQKKKPNKPHE